MARPKLHILNTESPILRDGLDITVNCKVELRNTSRAFMWDETVVGEMIGSWPLGTCMQCANISDKQAKGRHFIYGLKSGQAE
jgi:hypothetical protein